MEIRGRLNSQSTIRYGRDLRLREFWNVAVSIMMQKWHCVRQDWSMMREHHWKAFEILCNISVLCEFTHEKVWDLCMPISCGIQHRQLASHRLLQQDVGKGHFGSGEVLPKGTLLIEFSAFACSNSCGQSIKSCGFTFFGMC